MPRTPSTNPVLHQRARVARLSQSHDAADPQLVDARRELAAANLAEYIAKIVDAAPPLTAEQRDRLAALL
ncbi:MAG: hypothetical protein WAL50_07315, partial [Kineosporiaceae bacterium]